MASVKVAVRVRPFNSREIGMGSKLIIEKDGPKIMIRKNYQTEVQSFTYDYAYWSYSQRDKCFAAQEDIYDDLGKDVIKSAFQGYNACIFAYGQTGSGKSFTMMGSEEDPGLIPRICRALFERIECERREGAGYKVTVSYLEIYNERVRDLLNVTDEEHPLRIREHKTDGPYVENLSEHQVRKYEEIECHMMHGNKVRVTAKTNMNETSSRSHSIFTIKFVQASFLDDVPSETTSKIHLVDLAGSERLDATGAVGIRLKEAAQINKSLVTLGSVISALAEKQRTTNKYIPYRDSILTWLLKDSLGGNSKTIIVATVSPADCNYGETISTLRYANRAKNIINKPTINEDPNVRLIRELREEINRLRNRLTPEVDTKTLADIQKKMDKEKCLTEEWMEKWSEIHSILREQKTLDLRKNGLGVILDSKMPHLIGIENRGVSLYTLQEGCTTIGKGHQDINLHGADILDEHCTIQIENGIAMITPHEFAHVWLNGTEITTTTKILQGDILLLGRNNMFRYNNPIEMGNEMPEKNRDLSQISLIASYREPDEEESNEDEEIEVSNSNIGDTVIEHDENSAVITAEVASNSKLENPQKLEMFDIDLGTNRTCNYSDSSQCTDEESLITDQRIEECRCEILQMLNDSDCSVERLNEKITELSLLRSYRHSDGIESPVTSTTGNSCLVIDSANIKNYIRIVDYYVRGAGRQTHIEYEIRLTLPDKNKWSILRRYSRFRDMHNNLKRDYGDKVKYLPFPPKEFFNSKSETVANKRRNLLQVYLENLIIVCSSITHCPIYTDAEHMGLSKENLIKFSNFFRKGLFENGVFGTS